MLTREGCQARQQRLLREMEANRWDLFLTSDYRSGYYLTGALSDPAVPTVFALWQDGASVLVTAVKGEACASEIVPLEFYSIRRTITHPAHDAARLIKEAIARRPLAQLACAVEQAAASSLLDGLLRDMLPGSRLEDATTTILKLRKRKEPDEIEEIRESLRYCAVAYRAARETIAAGRTELDVYLAMYGAIAREAGTAVELAGDFACGERGIDGGGPPTRRVIQPGDLYILDIFPAPHLYSGDVCRTFAVSAPTDVQSRAWELVRRAVRVGETAVKPGVRARDVYALIKELLDADPVGEKSFWHHAGHGIGHRGHEAPRIIPGTDDIFEVGDVITLEPGVYSLALQGGIRLEDNYLVREHGLENLFDFPMEL
jgi:Xaa-Pro aminopeptidase